MNDASLTKTLGWKEDRYPFTLEHVTETAVGKKTLYNRLYDIADHSRRRIVLVSGPFGIGKSFMLRYLREKPPHHTFFVYLSGDYKRDEVLKNIVRTIHNKDPYVIKKKFFGLIREKVKTEAPEISENMLAGYINEKLGKDRLIVLWDDVQRVENADIVSLSILLLENTNTDVVLCGLEEGAASFAKEISFLNRGIKVLEADRLGKDDLEELIKKRIEWAGGKDYAPFTKEAVEYLSERFRGPRDLLNVCADLYTEAEEEFRGDGKIPEIDLRYVEAHLARKTPAETENSAPLKKDDLISRLSNLEKQIFDLLVKHDSKTSPQLVSELGKDRGTIAKTVERMKSKLPGMILVEKVEGKRRPENSYRLAEEAKSKYAER